LKRDVASKSPAAQAGERIFIVEDFRKFDERRLERMARWLPELRAWRDAMVTPIQDWTFTAPDGTVTELQRGAAWPVVEHHRPVRMSAEVTVPDAWAGLPVELQLWLGGEGFIKLTPGKQFGLNPFHQDFRLTDSAEGGETFHIDAEVMPKGMFGTHVDHPSIARAFLSVPHDAVRELELDLHLLISTAKVLKEHEIQPHLLDLVDDAYAVIAPFWPTSTEIAKTRLISGDELGGNTYSTGLGDYGNPGYRGHIVLPRALWHHDDPTGVLEMLPQEALDAYVEAHDLVTARLAELKERYPSQGSILLSGHAHIDLAWLWPVAETRRKARRTWSTQLRLMEKYEDFIFNQSSAQAYAWIEQDDPGLFAEIQQAVKDGKWEPVGGSWVEPDSQVSGGEAYVRQLFYGQRYFERAFGIRNATAWLPDVFGFSGAVPQILLGAGIENFFTIKVTWSEANVFPYDLFMWEGIDGSKVLTHTFNNPDGGYNGLIEPNATYTTWKNFVGKRWHDQTLLSFGWGDGGGGPSEDMLNKYARLKDYPVLPKLEMGKVEDFFASLPVEGIPTYVGELYLELHRATLTTQAATKRLMRQGEHRLAEAEAFAALGTLDGREFPFETLDAAWQDLLYNQFHDVLPGSSIKEVYQDTEPQLTDVVETAMRVRDEAIVTRAGTGTGAYAIVNPTLEDRPLTATLPENAEVSGAHQQAVEDGILIHNPAETLGGFETRILSATSETSDSTASSEAVTATAAGDGYTLENSLLRVEIGEDGTLHSVFDKRVGRETLKERGNQLWAYVDKPRAWDAWDIDETYDEIGEEIAAVDSIELVEQGPLRVAVRVTRTWHNSTFVQTYRLMAQSSRVDIKTNIDWHERMVLVRAKFPTTMHTHEAIFETMFGVHKRATHRNTTWERARFEVSAHRFVDLSEPTYGVALMNDAKYGHSAVDGELGISLVRGAMYPDPYADEGEHEFTYAFFPHVGDWVDADVVYEAKALNAPLAAIPVAEDATPSAAFVRNEGVRLGFGAMKKAHDREGITLRVYEPHGIRGEASLVFDRPVKAAHRTNLLEEDAEGADLVVEGERVTFDVRPFEIATMVLEF
jgi:alpha-mannosidase